MFDRFISTSIFIHGRIEAINTGICDFFPSIVSTTGITWVKVGGTWFRVNRWLNNHVEEERLPKVGDIIYRPAGSKELVVIG